MIKLPESWLQILEKEFEKDYMKEIISFLESEKKAGKIIYPEEKNIFRALELTKFEDIKVVIIGQDPYHQKGQAHGLAFSVPDGIKIPPSLRNIYKEIENSITQYPKKERAVMRSGNLENWAKQGVLLLNAILTVEDSKPASHSKIGWEKFTNFIISQISEKSEDVVFLLWGGFAKSKAKLINFKKHLVLDTSHPSPLGSYRGFLGSNCFLECNNFLEKKGIKKIIW